MLNTLLAALSSRRSYRSLLFLWLSLILGAALSLLFLPQQFMTESKGARDTEAYAVMQALRDDFHFHLGNTLALVHEGPVPKSILMEIPKKFPEVKALKPLPLAEESPLDVYTFDFVPGFEFVQAQDLVNRLRSYLQSQSEKAQLTGNLAFFTDILNAGQQGLSHNEVMALGGAFGVLFLSFGGFWAALLPIVMGLSSLWCFQGFARLVGLPGTPMSLTLSSLLGLALSLDYALFWIGRFREEQQAPKTLDQALCISSQSAGKTIAVSALIVWISIAVLLIPDVSGLRILALNLLCVSVFAVLHALVILPALLRLSHKALEWPQALTQWIQGYDSHALWRRYLTHITAHPLRYFLIAVLGFGALSAPLLQMKLWDPMQTLASPDSESVQAYNKLAQQGLGGRMVPVYVVVEGPQALDEMAGLSFIAELSQRIENYPEVEQVLSLSHWQPDFTLADYQRFYAQLRLLQQFGQSFNSDLIPQAHWLSRDRHKHLIYVFPRDVMQVAESHAIVDQIRKDLRQLKQKQDFASFQVHSGGVVERARDFTRAMYASTALMLGLILGGIFLVLWFYLKSWVLPLKAGIMNFLPILGAFGVLVLIYQWAWGSEAFGIPVHGAISSMIPMTLFCLTFGLSMDYEVLILSRIAENHQQGMELREAVIEGMARSGALISSAVLIFLILFLPACFSDLPALQELGFGIVAVLILDATLLRLLLVPSFMILLGRWNWWAPRLKASK